MLVLRSMPGWIVIAVDLLVGDAAIRAAMMAIGWIAEGDGPDLVVMCGPA